MSGTSLHIQYIFVYIRNCVQNPNGCSCEGVSFEKKACNTKCCPVWYLVTEDDVIGVKQLTHTQRKWSSCPSCGEAETVAMRECKCQNSQGRKITKNVIFTQKITVFTRKMAIFTGNRSL